MELAEGKGVAIENKQVRQLIMYCLSAPTLLSIAMITEVDTVNIPPLPAGTHYTLSVEVAGGTLQEERGAFLCAVFFYSAYPTVTCRYG